MFRRTQHDNFHLSSSEDTNRTSKIQVDFLSSSLPIVRQLSGHVDSILRAKTEHGLWNVSGTCLGNMARGLEKKEDAFLLVLLFCC